LLRHHCTLLNLLYICGWLLFILQFSAAIWVRSWTIMNIVISCLLLKFTLINSWRWKLVWVVINVTLKLIVIRNILEHRGCSGTQWIILIGKKAATILAFMLVRTAIIMIASTNTTDTSSARSTWRNIFIVWGLIQVHILRFPHSHRWICDCLKVLYLKLIRQHSSWFWHISMRSTWMGICCCVECFLAWW
jgi:hypothetical protein